MAGRRYIFGWNPTQTDAKDYARWNWGGSLVVHELAQRSDGTLAVRIPEAVRNSFAIPQPVAFLQALKTPLHQHESVVIDGTGSFRCLSAGRLPETAKIEATVTFSMPSKGFGVMLRTSQDFETGYYVRIEPQRSRLVFDFVAACG